MPLDKYKAVWVSHSSMGDFKKCPRSYYLRNVYKDPRTGRKINLVNPVLSLGIAVHEVLESLLEKKYPIEKRKHILESKNLLREKFEHSWAKVSGPKGGFSSKVEEETYKNRALSMLARVGENPEPLLKKALKLNAGKGELLPNYWLSEEDNILLCGKVDWLIYVPEDDSLHILDFKTGKNEEDGDSLQLPIYQLLLKNLQKRKVTGASYWYLDKENSPKEVDLPGLDESYEKVFKVAKAVKDARDIALIEGTEVAFQCPRGEKGCFACKPFEQILRGEARFIGVGEMRQDLYSLAVAEKQL